MNIPAILHNHITIEEISSLSQIEKEILVYICTVIAPMEYVGTPDSCPISITTIRAAKREEILKRVAVAESFIKEAYKGTYNGLRVKLGLPPLLGKKPEIALPPKIN